MSALDLKGGDMHTLKKWCRWYGADLVALLVVAIWGGSFVIRKVALDQFDVHTFNALRFLGMLALAWGVLSWPRHDVQVSPAQRPLHARSMISPKDVAEPWYKE
jgi:hypothetical protein